MNLQFFTVDGKTTFARSPLPLRSYRTVPAALVLNRSQLEPLDARLTLGRGACLSNGRELLS